GSPHTLVLRARLLGGRRSLLRLPRLLPAHRRGTGLRDLLVDRPGHRGDADALHAAGPYGLRSSGAVGGLADGVAPDPLRPAPVAGRRPPGGAVGADRRTRGPHQRAPPLTPVTGRSAVARTLDPADRLGPFTDETGDSMQVTQLGAAFASTDPTAAGGWFAEHLGFTVLVDLGWYVSTQHPDREELRVDFVQQDHDTWVEPGQR